MKVKYPKNHILCSNIFLLESELLVFVVIANSDAVLPRPQPWWLHLFAGVCGDCKF